MKIYDNGPWEVSVVKAPIALQPDGSEYRTDIRIDSDSTSASLMVLGNFKDDKEKIKHARFICDLLNSAVQKYEFMYDMIW